MEPDRDRIPCVPEATTAGVVLGQEDRRLDGAHVPAGVVGVRIPAGSRPPRASCARALTPGSTSLTAIALPVPVERTRAVFCRRALRSGQCVDRGVVDGADIDRDGRKVGVGRPVVCHEGEGVGSGEVRVRRVGEGKPAFSSASAPFAGPATSTAVRGLPSGSVARVNRAGGGHGQGGVLGARVVEVDGAGRHIGRDTVAEHTVVALGRAVERTLGPSLH